MKTLTIDELKKESDSLGLTLRRNTRDTLVLSTNIKLEKPELKTKTEGELICSGIIPGKKEYSKNIKLSANIPKPEIKANIEKQDIPNKIEIETGINPSLRNGINIDTILSDNIKIQGNTI